MKKSHDSLGLSVISTVRFDKGTVYVYGAYLTYLGNAYIGGPSTLLGLPSSLGVPPYPSDATARRLGSSSADSQRARPADFIAQTYLGFVY